MMIATCRGKQFMTSTSNTVVADGPRAVATNGRELVPNRRMASPTGAQFDDGAGMIVGARAPSCVCPSPSPSRRSSAHAARAAAPAAAGRDPAGVGGAGRRAGELQPRPAGDPAGHRRCACSFVVVAPVSWRVLFPERLDLRHGGVRLMLYGAIGAGVVLIDRRRRAARARHGAHAADRAVRAWWSVWRCSWSAAGASRATSGSSSSLVRAEARADGAGARGRARAAAGAAQPPRSALPVQHAERHRRVVPRRRRGRRARGPAAVGDAAHGARPASAPPTWPLARGAARWSRRCSRCTACAIPSASASCGAVPEPLPEVAVPPMLLLPLAENAVKHGAGGRAPAATSSLAVEARRAGQRRDRASPTRARIAGRARAAAGSTMVERRLALAYDGTRDVPDRRRRRRARSPR